jgi:hypothetical protein
VQEIWFNDCNQPKQYDLKLYLWFMVCVDLLGQFTTRNPFEINSLIWFEVFRATNKSATSIQDLIHNTWCEGYLQPQSLSFTLEMSANSEVSSNKCECQAIMTSNPNHLQIKTYLPQENAIIERVLIVDNDMLRSFDLENYHENLMNKMIITFFNQLDGLLEQHITQHCRQYLGMDMFQNTSFRANWDQIQKRKQNIINKSNHEENKSQIPYEYKVGDQVLLETSGILRKFSAPRTGPFSVMNVCNNGTIQIQKGIVSERVNILRIITPFNQYPN